MGNYKKLVLYKLHTLELVCETEVRGVRLCLKLEEASNHKTLRHAHDALHLFCLCTVTSCATQLLYQGNQLYIKCT